MRKIVLLLAVLLVGAGTMMAQTDKEAEKAAKQAEKEAKKAEKAAKKAAEEAAEQALFEQAVRALDAKDFVVEADRIEFKRGNFVYVSSSTNFVAVKGDKASIQLSFNVPMPGPNGIGGITVDGTTSSIEKKTDKKGNITYEIESFRHFGLRIGCFAINSKKTGIAIEHDLRGGYCPSRPYCVAARHHGY